MFFCIHYMNYTRMFFFFFYMLSVVWQLDVKEEKEHSGVIHIMYTKEHVYKFLIHQVVIQHSTYKRRKRTLWCNSYNVYKSQHVLFLLLYVECCMTTWCIKNLYTCSFVYIIWITPACSFSSFICWVHQVAIQHSTYKRRKRTLWCNSYNVYKRTCIHDNLMY
jgi:hypothetical protein